MGKEFMCYSCGQPFYAETVHDVYQPPDDYVVLCLDCYRLFKEEVEEDE